MGKLVHLHNSTGNTTGRRLRKNVFNNRKYRFRLTDFKNNYYIGRKPVHNSKCNFEVHGAGLMLTGDFCKSYRHISILAQEVVSITLIRGNETVDTFFMSPIHMLSKIGIPKRISRYLSFHPTEYKISETRILIEGKEQRLELTTSGYSFEKLKRSFKKRGYKNKLKIERRPSVDLSSFRTTIPEAEPQLLK